jgi:hypothetical protein
MTTLSERNVMVWAVVNDVNQRLRATEIIKAATKGAAFRQS